MSLKDRYRRAKQKTKRAGKKINTAINPFSKQKKRDAEEAAAAAREGIEIRKREELEAGVQANVEEAREIAEEKRNTRKRSPGRGLTSIARRRSVLNTMSQSPSLFGTRRF